MKDNTILPICFSCGSQIGDKFPFYSEIHKQRIEEYCKEHSCSLYDSATIENINMSDILDLLKIDNICCRKMFLSFIRNSQNIYD